MAPPSIRGGVPLIPINPPQVRAPISGRIGQQRITLGNLVREQENRPLVVINQTSPLDVVFPITQQWEQQVRTGQSLTFAGYPGLRGRVLSLDNTTNSSTGTVMVKARLSGPLTGLTPGESLSGNLLLRTLEDVLLLPQQAVQRGQQGPFVYAARKGRAVLVPITVLAGVATQSLATLTVAFAPHIAVAVPGMMLSGLALLATANTLEKVKASGAITLGVRDSSGALSYTLGDGKYVGYHVEVCQRIIEQVEKAVGRKLETKYVSVTSQNRIPLTQNGTVDLECGSTTNTKARQEQVAVVVDAAIPRHNPTSPPRSAWIEFWLPPSRQPTTSSNSCLAQAT